jgi:integrase
MAKVTVNGYKGTVYPERDPETGKVRHYVGALDLGYHPDGRRNRPKRKGPNKTAVMDKLTELAKDLDKGVKTARNDTVLKIVTAYVDERERQGAAPKTIKNLRGYLDNQIGLIGAVKLRDLTAQQVDDWLAVICESLSSDTVRKAHGLLSRAVDRAMRYGKVDRNVSRLVANPQGKAPGRPARSLTAAQVAKVFDAAEGDRFGAYMVVGITTGLRTDELRALTWADVDLDAGTVAVWRGDRSSGDTKTPQSKRALALATLAVKALRAWKAMQAAELAEMGRGQTSGTLVFTRRNGTAYTSTTAWEQVKRVVRKAGLDPAQWSAKDLRTSFVSIMSDAGVPREQIADLCGHDVSTLERHYRKQLQPVMRRGGEVMNEVFHPAA